MFDLIKLALIFFGCVAVYGLATGADLNTLFSQTIDHITPVVKSVLAGVIDFIKACFNRD